MNVQLIENNNILLKKAKRYFILIMLLLVWDIVTAIIFAIYLDTAICKNDKIQKNIRSAWIGFGAVYMIQMIVIGIICGIIYIYDYKKNRLLNIIKHRMFWYRISLNYTIIILIVALLIVNEFVCDNLTTYFSIVYKYFSVQFIKEVVFTCMLYYS